MSCREIGSSNEAGPSTFFPQTGSQSNLHSLAGQMSLVGVNRGLSIHDMALERSRGQYEDRKKSKGESNTGFGASSSSSGAAADQGTGETFTGQSEPAHGSAPSASNWQLSHQAHHAQAYSAAHYPTGYFNQVPLETKFPVWIYSMNLFSSFFKCLSLEKALEVSLTAIRWQNTDTWK